MDKTPDTNIRPSTQNTSISSVQISWICWIINQDKIDLNPHPLDHFSPSNELPYRMRNQVEIKIEGMSDGLLLHSLSLARNLLFQELNQIRSKYLYSSLLSSISATLIRTNIYLNENIFLYKNIQPWQEMTLSFEFSPRPR